MQKRKNGYPNSGYPYPTRISGYLPGSTRSVSDPNPKLYYPGITRIRPEYKNNCIRIRKIFPNQYPYPVPISGTLPVFTPTCDTVDSQKKWYCVVYCWLLLNPKCWSVQLSFGFNAPCTCW
jgi:hypothetical protein